MVELVVFKTQKIATSHQVIRMMSTVTEEKKPAQLSSKRDRFEYIIVSGFIRLILLLPYKTRVVIAGWLASWLVAPLAGYSKRIRENLAFVWPDLTEKEVRRLCRAVPNNAGRTLIEIFSGATFCGSVPATQLRGPGLAALDNAHRDGRPIILVSGHFGNYDAMRSAIRQRGHRVGALYRSLNNPMLNEFYVSAISKISEPVFSRDRRGLSKMIKFLRKGGTIALLSDQYVVAGEVVKFFGRNAPSAKSAADLALKYNAELIPVYGIRNPDGLSFDLLVENPIPHTDPLTMTQVVSDSLEAQVRKYPEQWLWIHKRWKPERQIR